MENTGNNQYGNEQDISSNKANLNINKRTKKILSEYGDLSTKITLRLEELEKEWGIEKTLEVNAAAAVLAGMVLGTTLNKKWYILPTAVAGFLLQHGLDGRSAPIAVLRFFGFRTKQEIEEERQSLMALQGDFDVLAQDTATTETAIK
ncbi:MAG: hypothetical protein WD431_05835 [Cyclobacteriaceae bacterium]